MNSTDNDNQNPATEELDTADCYASGERAAMVWYQELRERWLGPLLGAMGKLGIKPDHLTFLSLVFGLLFCPLYFYIPWLAFVCLLLHTAIDGLDGPLARHLSVASKAGSFTDTMCDQIVVVAVAVTVMCHQDQWFPIPAGSIYIFLYTLVVVFAMVRNAMGIPYSWVVRPRLVVYTWLFLEKFFFVGTGLEHSTRIVLWICNILFVWKVATGFFKIRRKLD